MKTIFRRLFNIFLSASLIIFSNIMPDDITLKAEKGMKEIASFEFEDDQFDDWAALGVCNLTQDTNIKYSGNSSIRVSERKSNWSGCSYYTDSVLKAGNTYSFSFFVYQDSKAPNSVYATLRITNSNGVTDYIHINSENETIPSETWSEIGGTIDIPEDTVSSLLYLEAPQTSVNFNVDKVTICEECDITDIHDEETSGDDEKDNTNNIKKTDKFSFGFESSDLNLIPRGGNIRLVKNNSISYSGKHSLYVSQREETWNGPSISTKFLDLEKEYCYSVYVYYDDARGNESQDFLINVGYFENGQLKFAEIGQQKVDKYKWTRVEGKFSLPSNAKTTEFSVQTANISNPAPSDLIDFYIDDISIVSSSVVKKEHNIMISGSIMFTTLILVVIILLAAILVRKRSKLRNYLRIKDIDNMTKVFNRNAYEKKLEYYEKKQNEIKNIIVLTCDLDHLKTINDNYGHEKGDEAIRRCADTLRDTIGWEGDVYRIGGDEFICFTRIPLLQICRLALEKEGRKESDYRFSASLGQCSYDELKTDDHTPDIKEIIKKADEMMYKEKEEKKN